MIQRRGFAAARGVRLGRHSGRVAAGTGPPLPQGKADRIIVMKSERRLYLVRGGEVMRSYQVALGRQPRGTKLYQGDGRTPEGTYEISAFNAQSRFHRSLRVSYPNEHDRAGGAGPGAVGRRGHHGPRPGAERRNFGTEHWRFNWTNGCIADDDGRSRRSGSGWRSGRRSRSGHDPARLESMAPTCPSDRNAGRK